MELLLFRGDRVQDVLLVLTELGVGLAVVADDDLGDLREASSLDTELVHVAARPPDEPAEDVPSAHAGGDDAVGDEEGGGAHVVRDDAERLLVLGVRLAGELLDLAEDGGEERGVVDGLDAVDDAERPLKAHPGVDVLLLQGRELPLGVLEVLHEDVVPDLGVVPAVAAGAALRSARFLRLVDEEDLGVGPAGAGLAGGAPPVVLLREEEDVVLRDALGLPELGGLGVLGGIGVASEGGDSQLLGRDVQDLLQELVAPGDGLLLEVVAQRPVPEHLEERQVAGVPDLVDVARPDALLEVGEALPGRVLLAQEIGHEGVHPGSGEENGGVVLGDEGGRADLDVAPCFEEIDVCFSEFLCFHARTSECVRAIGCPYK
jgi:hypothetical protein